MSEITEDSVLIMGSRRSRGGRPRAAEPMNQVVTVRMPTPEYDRLIKLASSRGEEVSTIVRSLLKIRIGREVSVRQKP
jgi:hypothetical protein